MRAFRTHVVGGHASARVHEQGEKDAPSRRVLPLERTSLLLVGCLLVGACALRLDGITQPSLSTRELHNALLAREYYLGDGNGLPLPQQRVLLELRHSVKPVEPPVLDAAAAISYRVTGGEHVWIPRLFSSLLWVVGGVFLYLIAGRVTSHEGAVVALALYLLWPFGVLISRFYMPDGTMVALLLGAALTAIRYWEQPSLSRLVTAGAAASVATAVKPGIAAVFLVVLFVALARSRRMLVAAIVRGPLLVYGLLSSVLAVGYYVYGTYLSDFLSGASEGRVEPQLLQTAAFWSGWREMLSIALPFPQQQGVLALVPLAAAIAGTAVARPGFPRSLLLGLAVGYLVYGLVFSAHTASHVYYVLPLIPILSLAIGTLVGAALAGLRAARGRQAVIALVALVVGVAAYKDHVTLASPYNSQAIADYRQIGRITHHTTRAIIVDERLRSPAMYWGWIVGNYWYPPTPAQDLPATGDPFPSWVSPDSAFLIVVQTSELSTETRLRAFVRNLPVVAETPRYVVFDLRGSGAVRAVHARGT